MSAATELTARMFMLVWRYAEQKSYSRNHRKSFKAVALPSVERFDKRAEKTLSKRRQIIRTVLNHRRFRRKRIDAFSR
jgi:hypothetical protein